MSVFQVGCQNGKNYITQQKIIILTLKFVGT